MHPLQKAQMRIPSFSLAARCQTCKNAEPCSDVEDAIICTGMGRHDRRPATDCACEFYRSLAETRPKETNDE